MKDDADLSTGQLEIWPHNFWDHIPYSYVTVNRGGAAAVEESVDGGVGSCGIETESGSQFSVVWGCVNKCTLKGWFWEICDDDTPSVSGSISSKLLDSELVGTGGLDRDNSEETFSVSWSLSIEVLDSGVGASKLWRLSSQSPEFSFPLT